MLGFARERVKGLAGGLGVTVERTEEEGVREGFVSFSTFLLFCLPFLGVFVSGASAGAQTGPNTGSNSGRKRGDWTFADNNRAGTTPWFPATSYRRSIAYSGSEMPAIR